MKKMRSEVIRAALVRLAAGRRPVEEGDVMPLVRELVRLGYAREYYGWRTDNWGGYTITDQGREYIASSK